MRIKKRVINVSPSIASNKNLRRNLTSLKTIFFRVGGNEHCCKFDFGDVKSDK